MNHALIVWHSPCRSRCWSAGLHILTTAFPVPGVARTSGVCDASFLGREPPTLPSGDRIRSDRQCPFVDEDRHTTRMIRWQCRLRDGDCALQVWQRLLVMHFELHLVNTFSHERQEMDGSDVIHAPRHRRETERTPRSQQPRREVGAFTAKLVAPRSSSSQALWRRGRRCSSGRLRTSCRRGAVLRFRRPRRRRR